jgi:replicative DNA helicase
MQLGEDVQKVVLEDEFTSAEEFYQIIDNLTMAIRPTRSGRMMSFSETENDFEEFMNSSEDLIKTGFNQFDNSFGGIGRGWLYILAGRPSVGKTAKALQMSLNIAHQNIGDVLVWSQEMTFNQLKQRMLSNVTGISFSKIRRKILDDYEKRTMMEAHRATAHHPLYVEDSHGVTIDQIRATAKLMQRKNGRIGAIFVDYLTRMNIRQEKNQSWSRAVGEVAKRFKWLAQELDCPVILLAQLNREGAEGAPGLHNLRDSGEIEQEADVVEFLWREDDKDDPNGVIVNSTIAKGRDIGLSTFKYRLKGWIQRYEDYKEEKSYEPNAEGFVTHRTGNRKRGRPA